jgi:hypothetical protein
MYFLRKKNDLFKKGDENTGLDGMQRKMSDCEYNKIHNKINTDGSWDFTYALEASVHIFTVWLPNFY